METEEQMQVQNTDIPALENNSPDGVDIDTSEPIGNNVDVKLQKEGVFMSTIREYASGNSYYDTLSSIVSTKIDTKE